MATNNMLKPAEKAVFTLISEAAFTSPFSSSYLDAIRRVAGEDKWQGEKTSLKASARVKDIFDKMEAAGRDRFRTFIKNDRKLVRDALLYDAYRRFESDFDDLIARQIRTGDRPCSVKFAKKALALFEKRGFTRDEAEKFFAFFYQLRRAYYFISSSLVGQSPSLDDLRTHLWRNIFTHNTRWFEQHLWNRMEDFSTILVGETGTGKGTAASAIGRSGYIPFDPVNGHFAESFTANFIDINLSQYPEQLIESELFGHKKGAFTGAVADHKGVFARCQPHGSIFLDEIGDISVPVQIKLLKVLQERSFSMVGSHKKERFNGRVIAATNKNIEELKQTGAFRADFYYRLCSDIIQVPPLREQIRENPETLRILLSFTIKRIIGEPSDDLLNIVQSSIDSSAGPDYAWPGNVRELEQAVRRIIITQRYSTETPNPSKDSLDRLFSEISEGRTSAQNLLASYCSMLYKKHGTYEDVARISGLDRRTVKKHILLATE